MTSPKIDYDYYFDPETKTDEFEALEIGKLVTPTGKIIACDPCVLHTGEYKHFVKTVATGSYPIKIVVNKKHPYRKELCAMARIECTNLPAVRWEQAERCGGKSSNINLSKSGLYIDSGLACFCDFKTQIDYINYLNNTYKKNPWTDFYNNELDVIFKDNASNKISLGLWANFSIPNSPNNIIMVETGEGDGVYDCYWGIDKNGNTTSLLLDFVFCQNEKF